MTEEFPILYILMRNDLHSMNPGKAMAQASHASNAYLEHVKILRSLDSTDIAPKDRYRKNQIRLGENWQSQTDQGFGTVLVLEASLVEIENTIQLAKDLGIIADTVVDPSYPYILDKETAALVPKDLDTLPRIDNDDNCVLFRKETTCAYLGGDKNDPNLQHLTCLFKLHP